MDNTFGENLKRLREKNNLSQDDLARMMGFKDRSAITRIEKGNNSVSYENIIKFSKIFNESPLVFFKSDNEQEEDPYSEYLPYIKNMDERDPEKLRVIREMLGMPPRTESTENISAIHAKMA